MNGVRNDSNDLVVSPDPDDQSALETLVERLEWAGDIRLDFGEDVHMDLPESLKEPLARLAAYFATNARVAIRPYGEIVTSQQAASLLGISRPHLIHLLETEGVIPYESGERPGRHRRFRLDDVLAYRERRLREARQSMSSEFDPEPSRADKRMVANA